MNRRFLFLVDRDKSGVIIAFAVCAGAFICGAVVGTFASGHVTDTSGMYTFFSDRLPLADGTFLLEGDFLSALLNTLKYHIAAVLLGTSLLGVLAIPALAAVRGFSLSFSMAVFIRCFGTGGIKVSLLLFGVTSLITIPCFFIVALTAFRCSATFLRTAVFPGGSPLAAVLNRRMVLRLLIAVLLPVLAAAFEAFLLPDILNFVAASLR